MKKLFSALVLVGLFASANAAVVGSVDTATQLIGSNPRIDVEVITDPLFPAVQCYVSHAVAGGGSVEDKFEADIDCVTKGTIVIPKESVPKSQIISSAKLSVFFKNLNVLRMVDGANRRLVYLVYSRNGLDGSPKNAISVVPLP